MHKARQNLAGGSKDHPTISAVRTTVSTHRVQPLTKSVSRLETRAQKLSLASPTRVERELGHR
jgi:hypothetical protein